MFILHSNKDSVSHIHSLKNFREKTSVQGGEGFSGAKGGKKKGATFVIDCGRPVEEKIMEIASLEKFHQEKIKVSGKAGALGDSVTVSREKNKISVTSDSSFSNRLQTGSGRAWIWRAGGICGGIWWVPSLLLRNGPFDSIRIVSGSLCNGGGLICSVVLVVLSWVSASC